MSESQGFNRLNEGVQRWVWSQKWNALRDIQERAIAPILKAECDVIISAATAAGKTEAALHLLVLLLQIIPQTALAFCT